MKKRWKALLAATACLSMALTLVPTTAHAAETGSVTVPARVNVYQECEGYMDFVYVDSELTATFTADNPGVIFDTPQEKNTEYEFHEGVLLNYIGGYEMPVLEDGYNGFCDVSVRGLISEGAAVTGTFTIPVPKGCDPSTAKYSVYTSRKDEAGNWSDSKTPYTAVSSYTDSTVSFPYTYDYNYDFFDYIRIEFVSTEPVPYLVIDGTNSTWTSGSTDDMTITVNGSFDKFQAVKMDGTVVDPANYTAESGSTIITLKKDYLAALTGGAHTLSVVYTDGEASTTLTVNAAAPAPATDQTVKTPAPAAKKDKVPKTGETDMMILWLALAACGGAGMVFLKRKKGTVSE